MTLKRYKCFDLPIDALSMKESVSRIESIIENGNTPTQHTVINAAKVVKSKSDPFLKQSIIDSQMVNIDGQAVVWAARLLGIPVPERVAGIDLMQELLKLADQKKWRIYLLGATIEVISELTEKIKTDYPNLIIAGSRNGYFTDDEGDEISKKINESKSQILFVGMPTPKKEKFIHKYRDMFGTPFCMGVGGSFDVLSGKTKRAPIWMQKTGLEWFFRLSQEPRRLFTRYAATNLSFMSLLLSELKKGQKSRHDRSN